MKRKPITELDWRRSMIVFGSRKRIHDIEEIEDRRWAIDIRRADVRIEVARRGGRLPSLNEQFPDLSPQELIVLHFRCCVGLSQADTARQMVVGLRQVKRIEKRLKDLELVTSALWGNVTMNDSFQTEQTTTG